MTTKEKPKLKPRLRVKDDNVIVGAVREYNFEKISKRDTRRWGKKISVKRKARVKNLSRSFRFAKDQVDVMEDLKEKYEISLSKVLDMMIDYVQDDIESFEDYADNYLKN